jgi:dipeptidyl aminopeptidase/acylaminoacyl peptidase
MTATVFRNLDDYLALSRVSALAVSVDGSRVVTTVAELGDTRIEYLSAVWEVDPAGRAPARRLTRSGNDESSPAFTVEGDLLFLASEPTSEGATETGKPLPSLWRLPAAGGEPIEVQRMPGGVSTVRTARGADVSVFSAPLLSSAQDIDDDRRLRKLRTDSHVTAILHTSYPVRLWDKDLGPDQPHLFDLSDLRDLTPHPGGALRGALSEASFDISGDGRFLVTTWWVPGPGPAQRSVLVRVELTSGQHSVIAVDPDADLEHPAISPDGSALVFIRETVATPERAPEGRCNTCDSGSSRCRWPKTGTAGRRR